MSLPRAKLVKNFPGCPVEATLTYLDGKWKGVILFHLMDGPCASTNCGVSCRR